MTQTCKYVKKSFGLVGNPNKKTWKNISDHMMNMSTKGYFSRLSNMTCHNLCTGLTTPPATASLLGLGLNFCIQRDKPRVQNYAETISCLTYDIRVKSMVREIKANDTLNGIERENNYIPKLYVKDPNFEPPPAPERVESAIQQLMLKIHPLLNTSKQVKQSNLTVVQREILTLLRRNDKFIVLIADKGMGPCIMERKEYTQWLLNEHLLKNTYSRLTEEDAK